jgi:hypothetical protein
VSSRPVGGSHQLLLGCVTLILCIRGAMKLNTSRIGMPVHRQSLPK